MHPKTHHSVSKRDHDTCNETHLEWKQILIKDQDRIREHSLWNEWNQIN